ncbi:hypothetical protein [Glutamicibacter sp. X7]
MRPKPLPDLWPEVRDEAAFSEGAEACAVVGARSAAVVLSPRPR